MVIYIFWVQFTLIFIRVLTFCLLCILEELFSQLELLPENRLLRIVTNMHRNLLKWSDVVSECSDSVYWSWRYVLQTVVTAEVIECSEHWQGLVVVMADMASL